MRQFAQLVVLELLKAYRWAISPMFPPACRYLPTCSEYAMEAVERYGVLSGGLVALWRLLRCHPFAQGGYDPVVKVAAGEKGATGFPQGLRPSHLAYPARQSLQRCATQNPKASSLNGAVLEPKQSKLNAAARTSRAI